MTTQPIPYKTLDDIQQRKDQLRAGIQQQNEQIGLLWHELTARQDSNSKGEMIASLVTNSITAIDGFLLVRKLMRNYGWLLKRKKKK